MKTMTQRFHKELVRTYKQTYFATIRKEHQLQQDFLLFYHKLLDSDAQLIALFQNYDHSLFFKHLDLILDQRLYQKLYFNNQSYFLQNLKFIQCLLQFEVLPIEHVDILVSAIAEVLANHEQVQDKNIAQILFTLEQILTSPKYLTPSFQPISHHQLIPKLFQVITQREENKHFFKLIKFCKILKNDQITQLPDQQKLHCLNIHILTSDITEELSFSYQALGQIFERHHTSDQELYEYGSILDKIQKDIVIDRLIDPISFFLVKAFKNQSITKLSVEMGYMNVIFEVILNKLLGKNNVSVHGHHSIWWVFGRLVGYLTESKATEKMGKLNWVKFKGRLEKYDTGKKNGYVRSEMEETMGKIHNTNEKSVLMSLIHENEDEIRQQLEEVQI